MASGDVAWLLSRAGIALPHDGAIDAIDAVDAALVGDEVLADLLARELGTVVIDLDEGMLEAGATELVPEAVARKAHAVAVLAEPGQRTIQVAFANPLDERAVSEVAEATGLRVQPLVAPLSGVRRALDREYGGAPVSEAVLARRQRESMVSESTQRLGSGRLSERTDELRAPATAPLVRMEARATTEQRMEALLLALIERGVLTRADYLDALRRLLEREGR
ncbi:MAG: hypothetical protein ACK6CU_01175 [Deltaproteobacteria bacterium]|jgi:hypothetical protein